MIFSITFFLHLIWKLPYLCVYFLLYKYSETLGLYSFQGYSHQFLDSSISKVMLRHFDNDLSKHKKSGRKFETLLRFRHYLPIYYSADCSVVASVSAAAGAATSSVEVAFFFPPLRVVFAFLVAAVSFNIASL